MDRTKKINIGIIYLKTEPAIDGPAARFDFRGD
jgi:hypothetical protein